MPMKVSGKCGSVRVRLIPAPRGTHVVGAPTTKKILAFAGIKDCFSSSNGSTKTRGNFMKVRGKGSVACYMVKGTNVLRCPICTLLSVTVQSCMSCD